MRLPSGWYVILDSKEVGSKPVGIERFGARFVVWRKSDGSLVLMDDHCPHRRAHLSLGKIVNDQIECPFHGFKFDSSGQCKWVPELKRDAPGIHCGSWPVREARGWIWMYHGVPEEAPKDLPWFEKHENLLHYTRYSESWPVHFTRSVENQLDYAHLPFVHRTSIGRFAKIDAELKSVCDDSRIQWSFRDGADAGIEFVFPNIWSNVISAKYFLTLAFVPVNERETKLYLRSHRDYLTFPPFSWVMDFVDRLLNRWILGQDRAVVISQKPENSLDADERLVGSDRFIRHFREWMRKA
jgi:phenylpropionate dioxygenase-like ring-hydroxylating dioxygenase large terminal subunit